MRFRVGVPFEANHANPATAPAPLNYTFMHWSWRAGYKFVRFGTKSEAGAYKLHLGSTGCEGTVGDVSGCARGNRPLAEVPGGATITLDVARLLESVELAPPGCMVAPDDPLCVAVLANLALDSATGEPTGPTPAFR